MPNGVCGEVDDRHPATRMRARFFDKTCQAAFFHSLKLELTVLHRTGCGVSAASCGWWHHLLPRNSARWMSVCLGQTAAIAPFAWEELTSSCLQKCVNAFDQMW